MAHHDDPLGAGITGQLDAAGQVVRAQIEIVRLAVPDAHELDATLGPSFAEALVQPVTRPEHAAHRAATRNDRRTGRPRLPREVDAATP